MQFFVENITNYPTPGVEWVRRLQRSSSAYPCNLTCEEGERKFPINFYPRSQRAAASQDPRSTFQRYIMQRDTKLFIDLPPDILIQVFSECDVFDVLSLSSVRGWHCRNLPRVSHRLSQTCKRLRLTANEYQIWSRQAKRLQIPIEHGVIPSRTELKDSVISRAKVDVCWVKGRSDYLKPHSFRPGMAFLSSHYLPGGKFVVLLYATGSIDLKKIQDSDASGWTLVDLARYEQQNYNYPAHWSGLLTGTSYGYPALAYMNETCDKYVPQV